MHKWGVEAPGKAFGERWTWHFGGPVVVRRVAVARQRVLGEGLHQPVELGTEASLAEVRAGVE